MSHGIIIVEASYEDLIGLRDKYVFSWKGNALIFTIENA